MEHSAEMRRCLLDCDVAAYRRLVAHVGPNMPQARTNDEALAQIHLARTVATSIPVRPRSYSHRWLLDHGLPSMLPDHLKPRAKRMYPRIASAVLHAYCPISGLFKAIKPQVDRAVADAILEAEGDGLLLDAAHVRARMRQAKDKTIHQLLGVRADAVT